jgi:hypothetical protein
MTTSKLRTYSLFPAVILWGTLLGGIAYSHLVYFPVYLSALPDSAALVNGPYGLNEGIFWIIIHPLLIVSLIIALATNWKSRPRRKLILISCLVYILALVITGVYFVPELEAFRHSPESGVSRAEWLTRGQRWQKLSWIRGIFMYAGILPLLLALSKPGSNAEEPIKSETT